MDRGIIVKILNGQATENEKNDFFLKCEIDPELKDEYIRLKNLWAFSIDEHSNNKQKLFDKFWLIAQRSQVNRFRHILFETVKYAAVLIVALGIAWFVNLNMERGNELVQTFKSEKGSVSSIELSDGSKIWLNSASELKFIEKNEKRIVARLSGEAFFEISHNPKREFIIDADQMRIHDLGTEFNIRAYPHDDNIVASLKEGSINVELLAGKRMVTMNPNDHLVFQKSANKCSLEKTNPQYIAGWKDGKFVFIDKNLREICDELEKWYDVKIIIGNRNLEQGKYTSILKRTTSIRHMLDMLKITTGLNYEIKINKNGSDMIIIK